MTTQWIVDVMEEWAPSRWAMETDNVGLLVGDRARPVSRILTALDVSEDVLREAVQNRFDFIVTHHPLISRHVQPINRITTDNPFGKKIMTLIGSGIGLFCAHTNLDVAPGGVNDLLFDLIGLTDKEYLISQTSTQTSPQTSPQKNEKNEKKPTLGLIGQLPHSIPLSSFAEHVGRVLSLPNVRYVGATDKQIRKVGLCGGNGTALINYALEKKCDVYITGDLNYHLAMFSEESGMALIDGTHYSTEVPISQAIANYLSAAAARQRYDLVIQASSTERQVFKST